MPPKNPGQLLTEKSNRSLGGLGLLLGLVATSAIALVWPQLASWFAIDADFDPFRLSKNAIWGLISVTMLCLGLVVERSELEQLRSSPLSVLVGLAIQTTCMPLFAFGACQLLQLEGQLASGVILVGCVPGAMASNVLTMTARGNVSYSVSLTAVATLASPITVPILLSIFADASTDLSSASGQLFLTVVLPIVIGFAAKEIWTPLQSLAARICPAIASVALLWIIASVVAGARDLLFQISASVFVALLVINIAGYLAGSVAGRVTRMPTAMCRALTLEVGMQNAGVGTGLAASLYGTDTLAVIPTAAYTFGCMATGTLLAAFWASRAIDDAPTECQQPPPHSQGASEN
ncbi:MAG TPA: hypothetical protein DDW52_19235 [Planctomycetaceae bacterium]|nr:hypothetical protein [Planctomycetaceae bacterium]